MKTRHPRAGPRLILVTGLLFVLFSSATAYNSTSAHLRSESQFLGVDEIRPGMVGVGRTVFQGHVPEEFEVEILGILKNALAPQQDLIVSRLRGVNVERTGVISGMSGSPVTIQGKLIGAISYRLGIFEKEAIAGITPIADMLRVAELPVAEDGLDGGSLLARWADLTSEPGSGNEQDAAGNSEEIRPIATPLVFAGFPEGVMRRAGSIFRALGLRPVQGGGGGGAGADYEIEPGVPLALELVRGDLNLSTLGTVTHVDGNRIWAFGHPFLGTGPVRLPMARAEVVVVYPSAFSSFMISSTTNPLGTLLQDRITAVQGVMGPVPEMIPVEVKLDTVGEGRSFSYEICDSPLLAPVLVGLTLQASLQQIPEFSTHSTYHARLEIEIEGHSAVRYMMAESDAAAGQATAVLSMAAEAASVFNAVFNNRFERTRIRSLRLKVSRISETRVARIQEISVHPSPVRRGQEITARVSLQPFRGKPVLRELRVKLPPDTPSGPMGVIVSSARSLSFLQRGHLQRRFTGIPDLQGLIEFLNNLKRDDTLYLQLTRHRPGALVEGQALPALPLSVFFMLGSNRFAGQESQAPNLPLAEQALTTDFVLTGARSTTLRVR